MVYLGDCLTCREVKQLPPPPPPCMAMEEDLLDLDLPTSFPFQPLPLPLSDFTSFSFDPFPRSVEADGTDCFAGCGSNTSAIGGSFK
ncbi:hypothetical protein M0R45_025153 [Rubus argutus]|uniref:Uncharacterized protein n=1 Tax=Rubus argutus TaxID=59490 RepID=A0AAW1WTA0_RUBAR